MEKSKSNYKGSSHPANLFTEEGFPKWREFVRQNGNGRLSTYSIFSENDKDLVFITQIIQAKDKPNHPNSNINISDAFDRSLGCFIRMVIGDALGAPFEFLSYRPSDNPSGTDYMMDGFSDGEKQFWKKSRFKLKPGQWTDDASMGLCVADSLLKCKGFDGIDMRRRFHLWWFGGYCNAFRKDGHRGSVGLGGNISLSLEEFASNPHLDKTKAGDFNTSGNGSVMRNAAIPIFYQHNPEKALEISSLQSQTTHQGIEAAECCRLLTYIVLKAFEKGEKSVLDELDDFKSEKSSVNDLAFSKESDNPDANWNWKAPNYRYSPTRAKQQPGYVGSYVMDAMAMALHCVYTTNSFKKAMIKCANLRGDSDTVCAVAGQIAGAIYGWKNIPNSWYQAISKWDTNDHIFLRVYKMYYFNHIETENLEPENTDQKENIDQNIVPLEIDTKVETKVDTNIKTPPKSTHNNSGTTGKILVAGSIHLIDGNNYIFGKNGSGMPFPSHSRDNSRRTSLRNSSPTVPTGGGSSNGKTMVATYSNSAVYNSNTGDNIVTINPVNIKDPVSYNSNGHKNGLTKTRSSGLFGSSNGKNTGGTNGQPKKKGGFCTLL